jgi:hypothetical protein
VGRRPYGRTAAGGAAGSSHHEIKKKFEAWIRWRGDGRPSLTASARIPHGCVQPLTLHRDYPDYEFLPRTMSCRRRETPMIRKQLERQREGVEAQMRWALLHGGDQELLDLLRIESSRFLAMVKQCPRSAPSQGDSDKRVRRRAGAVRPLTRSRRGAPRIQARKDYALCPVASGTSSQFREACGRLLTTRTGRCPQPPATYRM